MPPDAPLVLCEGSALEQLEDYLECVLRGQNAAKVRRRVLELADCHAAQVVEKCLRPYPVPGKPKGSR